MGDRFGSLAIPLAADADPIGDPALAVLGAFAAAVLNSDAQAAWTAAFPRPSDAALQPVVRDVFLRSPTDGGWAEHDLPALFLWRERGRQTDRADEWRAEDATFRLLWVFPRDGLLRHVDRAPVGRGLMAVLGAALSAQRHPAWVSAADAAGAEGADAKAPSLVADPDAIVVARVTSTSPTTVAGTDLDGAIGGDPLDPRRGLTVTTSAAPGAYSTTAPILVTYLDWHGVERTDPLPLTSTDGGETVASTFEAARVLQVAIPAQASSDGTLSVGLQARPGRGSQLLDAAGFVRLSLDEWQPTTTNVDVLDDAAGQRIARTIKFPAIQATLTAQEKLVREPATSASPLPTSPAGLDLDVVVDGLVATRAELDGVPTDD